MYSRFSWHKLLNLKMT